MSMSRSHTGEETALFIGRLTPYVCADELRRKFVTYGAIKRCEVKRGGYGFVEYYEPEHASKALGEDGAMFCSARIAVQYAKARKATPGSDECFRCGGTGHWSRNCPRRSDERGSGYPSRDSRGTTGSRYSSRRHRHSRSYSRSRSRSYSPSRSRSRSRSRNRSRRSSPQRSRRHGRSRRHSSSRSRSASHSRSRSRSETRSASVSPRRSTRGRTREREDDRTERESVKGHHSASRNGSTDMVAVDSAACAGKVSRSPSRRSDADRGRSHSRDMDRSRSRSHSRSRSLSLSHSRTRSKFPNESAIKKSEGKYREKSRSPSISHSSVDSRENTNAHAARPSRSRSVSRHDEE